MFAREAPKRTIVEAVYSAGETRHFVYGKG
jgi:hypothetical protein